MTLQFFALQGTRVPGSQNFNPQNNSAFSEAPRRDDRRIAAPVREKRTRLIAAWHVNAETGRLECTWMPDDEPSFERDVPRTFERLGIILAIHQQGRSAV